MQTNRRFAFILTSAVNHNISIYILCTFFVRSAVFPCCPTKVGRPYAGRALTVSFYLPALPFRAPN